MTEHPLFDAISIAMLVTYLVVLVTATWVWPAIASIFN